MSVAAVNETGQVQTFLSLNTLWNSDDKGTRYEISQ